MQVPSCMMLPNRIFSSFLADHLLSQAARMPGPPAAIFELLEEHLAADVLAASDTRTTLAIAEDLPLRTLSDLVEERGPDDAADLL